MLLPIVTVVWVLLLAEIMELECLIGTSLAGPVGTSSALGLKGDLV